MLNIRLRELRIEHNLSQKELSGLLDVTNQTILNWENHIYEPTLENLVKIADLFGVNIDYVVGRSPYKRNIKHYQSNYYYDEDFIPSLKKNINEMLLAIKHTKAKK